MVNLKEYSFYGKWHSCIIMSWCQGNCTTLRTNQIVLWHILLRNGSWHCDGGMVSPEMFAWLRLISQVTVDVFLTNFKLCRLVHNGWLRHVETIQWSGPWQFKTTHLCQLCLHLWYPAHTLWLFQLQRLCPERSHHWWPTISLWLLQRLLRVQRA